MKIPPKVRHYGDAIVVPIALILLYIAFTISANATGAAAVLAGIFMLIALGLWVGFRRLRLHAAAARLAAIGEPAQLLTLADDELARRWFPAGKASLNIYRAMAFNLMGKPTEAQAALVASGVKPGARATRSWLLLWSAADIDARTRLGDAVGARKTYDTVLVPSVMLMPSRGIDLMTNEAEARVLLAEGDAEGARAKVTPHVKDIRLGPAARAQLYAIVAASERKLGNDAAAEAATAKALELAPAVALVS